MLLGLFNAVYLYLNVITLIHFGYFASNVFQMQRLVYFGPLKSKFICIISTHSNLALRIMCKITQYMFEQNFNRIKSPPVTASVD